MNIFEKLAEGLKGPHDSTGMAIAGIVVILVVDKLTSGNYELNTRNGAISILQRIADPEPELELKDKQKPDKQNNPE